MTLNGDHPNIDQKGGSMTSLTQLPTAESEPAADRYARVRLTPVFRNGGFPRWQNARIAVAGGGGTLGWLLTTGIVRSGASVGVIEFDTGSTENLGTQLVRPGVPKVDTVVAACNDIDPGRAHGHCCDVRHVGVGVLAKFDVILDVTDDPNLAFPLTVTANGLGKVAIRAAVEGSGQSDIGRVLCSSPATGHACQICHYRVEDLRGNRPRTACPNDAPLPRLPTIAGGATAMTIAGCALLGTQRVVTGNDDHLVYDRETIIDLTNMQLLPMQLRRSERCLSGHRRWDLIPFAADAAMATPSDLFGIAAGELATADVSLEFYLHPLNVRAECVCGEFADAVGSNWAVPPACRYCRIPMKWNRAIQHDTITRDLATELGILKTPLAELGIPEKGAMVVARAPDKTPLRYVLQC
jgi:hypothetical protein